MENRPAAVDAHPRLPRPAPAKTVNAASVASYWIRRVIVCGKLPP
jgi:hypothetical protein